MSYRVCIPTAGTGSRLGELTKFINKSLVSIANRPILSHIIEQFPSDVEFVIPLGYKGNLVREFLELAYGNRKFFFQEVSLFEGYGSGLGLSLISCKRYLQQPFIFISCDTLVKEPIPSPQENWMAFSETAELKSYRTLKITDNQVLSIHEKEDKKDSNSKAYIGLAGIKDYQAFWSAMDQDKQETLLTGEVFGLRTLLVDKDVMAHAFTWYDTGNVSSLNLARSTYQEQSAPSILEKTNEAIWFVDNQVIKFSDDQKFIANRVKRVQELNDFVPKVTDTRLNMYRYSKVEGKVLSDVISLPLFEKLLQHCKRFWIKKEQVSLTETENDFREACMKFYRDKTFERVALFYKNFNQKDGTESINGLPMPKLEVLLNLIDWEWLAKGLPARFHGDLHFENILWDESKELFTFLDWRQDFGGNTSVGDIYYDFAKLLHGMIITHEFIAKDLYRITRENDRIIFDFHRKQILVECERHFVSWLESEGYDRKKVWILTALIYLNIAALHHNPYSLLLFALGKSMLNNELES